jgi:hypothetical protein
MGGAARGRLFQRFLLGGVSLRGNGFRVFELWVFGRRIFHVGNMGALRMIAKVV